MILIEVSPNEKVLIDTELNNNYLKADFLNKKNFNGQTEILEVLIQLSTFSIPIIAGIIIKQIKARKHIEVKYKGLKIKGLSETNTVKILEKLIEKENDN
jgi:aspartyl/asparaginyl-tRNA synthetase